MSTAVIATPMDLVNTIHNVISNLLSRNNLSIDLQEAQERTLSLAEICKLTDAELVFRGYMAFLGRNPDLDGFRTYVTALRRGVLSRRAFLEILQRTPKAKTRRVRILHDATEMELAKADRQNPAGGYVFYTGHDFEKGDVDEFLRAAYKKILMREADSSGLTAYRDAMATGTTHIDVLKSFLASDEHKSCGAPTVIFGITPIDEVFRALFSAVEDLSENMIVLEHRLHSSTGI